jgi:hypothetical protein
VEDESAANYNRSYGYKEAAAYGYKEAADKDQRYVKKLQTNVLAGPPMVRGPVLLCGMKE